MLHPLWTIENTGSNSNSNSNSKESTNSNVNDQHNMLQDNPVMNSSTNYSISRNNYQTGEDFNSTGDSIRWKSVTFDHSVEISPIENNSEYIEYTVHNNTLNTLGTNDSSDDLNLSVYEEGHRWKAHLASLQEKHEK